MHPSDNNTILTWQSGQGLGNVVLDGNVPSLSWLDGLPLEDDLLTGLGGLDLLCGVGLDSV